MFAYLMYVGSRLVFLLVLVPALFLGCFYGLVQLGFPPMQMEVWGLAVLGGTAVLVLLDLLGWLLWKLRGSPPPTPPPQLPGWARFTVMAGALALLALGVGIGGLSGASMLSLGTWWEVGDGSLELGRIVLERDAAAGGSLHYKLSFVPRAHPEVAPVEGSRVYGETFLVEVDRVRFDGPSAELFGRLGMTERIWPGELYARVDAGAEPIRAGPVCGDMGVLARHVLAAVAWIPGVEVSKLKTGPVTPGDRLELGLRFKAGKPLLGEPGPEPTRAPAPTPDAAPTPAPGPGPTGAPPPTRPGGPGPRPGDPTRRPVATPTGVAVPPSPATPGPGAATPRPTRPPRTGFEGTYTGDPLEGLE